MADEILEEARQRPVRMPVQVGTFHRPGVRTTVPTPIAEMAYAEYARQYGTDQSFERLHQRGGFGVIELMTLLCQRIVFVEARFAGKTTPEARKMAREWRHGG